MQEHLEPRIADDVIELVQRRHPESLPTRGQVRELVRTAVGDCFRTFLTSLGSLQTDQATPAADTPADNEDHHDRMHASGSADPGRDQIGKDREGSYPFEMVPKKTAVTSREPMGNLPLAPLPLAQSVLATPGMTGLAIPIVPVANPLLHGTIEPGGLFYAHHFTSQHQAHTSWPAPGPSWSVGYQDQLRPATNLTNPPITFGDQRMPLASNPPDWVRGDGLIDAPSTSVFDNRLPDHFSTLNRREPHGLTNSMLGTLEIDAGLGFDPSTYALPNGDVFADE